ncbi:MAG: CsgG/HfaB family protein [Methylotenera sp.]|nr:CsgG/HfaB family protein [Methylotenera sp.]
MAPRTSLTILAICFTLALPSCASEFSKAAAPVSPGLSKLTKKPVEGRVAVAIYEVTSAVPELQPRGTTEMFKTALVKSGQFRVVERSKLNRGVVIEKQMNAAGQTSGNVAQSQLRGAAYLFQVEITEVTAGTSTNSTGINIAGMQLGGASNRDQIGLDVSIIDASNGDMLDAINIRKDISSGATSVSGIGALANTVLAQKGKTPSPYTPEVSHQSTRKGSLDSALREALEEAVRTLAERFGS